MRRHRFETYLDRVVAFSAKVGALPDSRHLHDTTEKGFLTQCFWVAACQFSALHRIETECNRGAVSVKTPSDTPSNGRIPALSFIVCKSSRRCRARPIPAAINQLSTSVNGFAKLLTFWAFRPPGEGIAKRGKIWYCFGAFVAPKSLFWHDSIKAAGQPSDGLFLWQMSKLGRRQIAFEVAKYHRMNKVGAVSQ